MNMDIGEIFVFGSNLAGRHGAGAAKQAVKYGARYGIGVGLQGDTYAIPTKDVNIKTLPLEDIKEFVDDFVLFSEDNKYLTFLVTRIGCGLAGYNDSDIAPMFVDCSSNVKFSSMWEEFLPCREYWTNL